MPNQPTVTTFDPRFRADFRSLNLEWIEKHFKVERKDLEQVNQPEDCVSSGGQVFFVLDSNGAVGTCALYKMGPAQYELAKMAVHPSARGRGFGDLLMIEAEKWAKNQNATEIVILSNTVLAPAIALYKKHGYGVTHLGAHPDYERCNIEMRKQI